jgi:hypothetical protein
MLPPRLAQKPGLAPEARYGGRDPLALVPARRWLYWCGGTKALALVLVLVLVLVHYSPCSFAALAGRVASSQ